MKSSQPHKSPVVKITQTGDIPIKKSITTQLQGLGLIALEEYARDRGIRNTQAVAEILEQRLVKEGYLPEWWFERGSGIH